MTVFRGVQVDGRVVDVRVADETIAEIGVGLPADGSPEISGGGRALIPGLHDHHVHLFATAAAATSVSCGPPEVHTPAELAAALAAAPGDGWVRGVGYDESVAGDLDRRGLDLLVADRPARVQHRGGSLWVVNSAGRALLGADAPADGRLWRRDAWLRERIGPAARPSLCALSARLAAYGVTGVTDATPGDARALGAATARLPLRVLSLGDVRGSGLTAGPRKIVLSDHRLPTYDELAAQIRSAHAAQRAVAVHSVTRASLILLLAVLAEVGPLTGDRVEHAAVAPPEAVEELVRLGVAVVTQPSLITRRGDDYLDRVEPDDRAHLWRYATLRAVGVPVACSSDAPYGDLDPWATIRAARDRLTASGRVLGEGDRVAPAEALAGFLAHPADLGNAARRVEVGADADLVLLDAPLHTALSDPDARRVVLTMMAGRVVYNAPDESR